MADELLGRILVAALCLFVVGLLVVFFLLSLKRKEQPRATLPDAIVTAGSAVVSFRPNPEKLDVFLFNGGEAGVVKKLQEILAANPGANLEKLQDALGITVTRVERPKRKAGADVVVLDE